MYERVSFVHLFIAFVCHISYANKIYIQNVMCLASLIGLACISESSVHTYLLFRRKKYYKRKQTNTNCIRRSSVWRAVYKTIYQIYIIFTCSPFSGYPIQHFFLSFLLFLSNNESERRTNKIWKGCIMCVCTCVLSIAFVQLKFGVENWGKKTIFFFIYPLVRCGAMGMEENGHKVEHTANKNMWPKSLARKVFVDVPTTHTWNDTDRLIFSSIFIYLFFCSASSFTRFINGRLPTCLFNFSSSLKLVCLYVIYLFCSSTSRFRLICCSIFTLAAFFSLLLRCYCCCCCSSAACILNALCFSFFQSTFSIWQVEF